MREPIEVDEATGEAKSGNAIQKLYGEGRAEEVCTGPFSDARVCPVHRHETEATEVPLEPASEMQHVAGAVLRRGRAQANEYGAELVVIAIERDPNPRAVLEALPDPRYGFGYASTSDDSETIALALHAIAKRLERA